eukprot:gene15494-biopygen705
MIPELYFPLTFRLWCVDQGCQVVQGRWRTAGGLGGLLACLADLADSADCPGGQTGGNEGRTIAAGVPPHAFHWFNQGSWG